MTQVQKESIPEILKGKDVFVKAKTGTGKTLAFLIPAIEVLIAEKSVYSSMQLTPATCARPMVLVLSPTRELAQQIGKVEVGLGSNSPSLSFSFPPHSLR